MDQPDPNAPKLSTALKNAQLGFIGAGIMAEAMFAGLLNEQLIEPDQVVVSHPRAVRRDQLREKYAINVVEQNIEAVSGSNLVLLTIKPQVLKPVLRQLAGQVASDQVVLSIIAGTTIETLVDGLKHSAVVRVMPNTPAQIGQGMMVWTATKQVNDTGLAVVRDVLGALGEELQVDQERYVDMATALSGTGPTYVFLMMEALIDAGVHMGFPRRIAEQIVIQTVAGSVEFARDSGKHMAELRNMVTSPGGTSADAIYQMEKGGLRTVYSRAVYAAFQRTRALAESEE